MSNGRAGGQVALEESGAVAGPLDDARACSVIIEAEAEATESFGTLAPKVVDAFRRRRLFSLFVPEALGGLEADIVTFLDVIEEVSRSDGSAGWSLMANALSTGFAGSYLDDTAVAELFGSPEDVVVAGMPGPAGQARAVDGGYVVSGRYQFASGSGHANWLICGALVSEGAEQGKHIVYCVPKDSVSMLGGWDVLGLEGTGSYDYEVTERFVAQGRTFDYAAAMPRRGGPLYGLGVQVLGSAGHAGVAVGLARRALEEVAEIAGRKVRAGQPPVADQPLFQHDFAWHEAAFQAARSRTWEVFRDAQESVAAGRHLTDLDVLRVRQITTYSTGQAADIVSFCYQWAGSAGLRNPSAIGRCLRDVYACTQHKYVDQNTLVDAGRLLVGAWGSRHAAASPT